jgi:Rne/Rng family ribonuclease
VAYVEAGVLTDFKIERKTSPTLVGSIHRGKVIRVLPGMQAAFVDIGLNQAAFIYVDDVYNNNFEGGYYSQVNSNYYTVVYVGDPTDPVIKLIPTSQIPIGEKITARFDSKNRIHKRPS